MAKKKLYPEGGKVNGKDKAKLVVSNDRWQEISPLTYEMELGKLQQSGDTLDLANRYRMEELSKTKKRPARTAYYKNFPLVTYREYSDAKTSPYVANMPTDFEIPEMSLGGILADTATGAGSGALGGAAAAGLGAIPGAIIGGGIGLIKGLKSHFAEKKAEKLQDDMETGAHANWARGMQNFQMMNNPYASTFAFGGNVPVAARWNKKMQFGGGVPNVELEKEEVFQTPNGQVGQVDGPTHANGGVPINLEPGTRVYSDRLKASTGKTFAEEAEKIKKQIAKYEKILNDGK